MSEQVRSTRCRPSGERSRRWITLMMIVAMFGFAGLVFAGSGPTHTVAKIHPPVALNINDADDPPVDSPAPSLAAPPANDTCSGAIALTLNRVTKGTTVNANDDYQTPATVGCYPGVGQTPTTAPGRDVVFSFTAPATRKYSFRIVQQNPGDGIRLQNEVLYLTDCANAGEVTCLAGANRPRTAAFVSSTGTSNNQSEEVVCYPMNMGDTVYVVFDDGAAANAGGTMSLEPIECNSELEPNDTPGTATPYVCGIVGESGAKPIAHCHLGTRGGTGASATLNDGAVCTRSTFLDQSLPDSNMQCSISLTPCSVNLATGVGTCGAGEGFCQQLTDKDCDPRCDVGPNAGLSCTANTFCNPVSDQGAVCAGTCQFDSVCIVTSSGLATATSCTPICVGGLFPGRFCSALGLCPGGGVCTTNAMCPSGQTCGRQFNEGDADFYSLGTLAPSSKVFVGMDAKSANDYDFRMRVTTTTNTLQFDDDDGVSRNGSNAPEIAGALIPATPAGGTAAFIKVSRTQARQSGPYELYAIVRPPVVTAQSEDERVGSLSGGNPAGNDIYFGWPGDVLTANAITAAGGGYVKALFNGTHGGFGYDSDCFKFVVNEGDLMSWFGDGAPQRSASFTVANAQNAPFIIYDAEPAGISNFIFGSNARKYSVTANSTLNGLTPAVTSTFFQWRASYTGMLEVCSYEASIPLGLGAPIIGSQPFNYAGSLDCNCGPCQPACKANDVDCSPTDVSVVKTGPAGPVQAGSFQSFTIAVTNNGSNVAQEVHMVDVLDPNLLFISLTVDDGFGGNNTSAIVNDGDQFLNSIPASGDSGTVEAINASMAPGTTTTYTLTVQVANCIGVGDISNTATIFSMSTDSNQNNNTSTTVITTADDGNCVDLFCPADGSTCYPNLCTSDNTCANGICGGNEVLCDDQSLCTDDVCVEEVGCVYDSSQLGDLCDDFIDCTFNSCDPDLYCVFTDTCDTQSNQCTIDVCNRVDPEAGCFVAGPVNCDDINLCTDDSCTETGGCQHPAHNCNDLDACTDDSCIPASGCQTAVTNCDDGDCCTIDQCDVDTGCFTTHNNQAPVIDPSLAPAGASCAILWPPQHGYVDFSIGATGTPTSTCGVASYGFTRCESSQPENAVGVGDGNSWRDCVYTATTLSLRAERDGACSPIGRDYAATVTATDVCGNVTNAQLHVGVWHDRGHNPTQPYFSANPGSNQNDQRPGSTNNPGDYGTGCGSGSPCATGTGHDSSDADPEMEIFQGASISVGDLRLQKASGGNVSLTWTEPSHAAGINVTRFHIYRLDPVTLFWTQLAEVTKQVTSWLDPALDDGIAHQYKVSAVIK